LTGCARAIVLATTATGQGQNSPPLSAIGVDYLFEPDVLVEVEAFAVLD
jgi:hypothetical protein